MEQQRYRRWFWAIVAVAGTFRVLYVLVSKANDPLVGDQIYYSAQAVVIANGDWFADPFVPDAVAADHVPLTALAIAPVSWSDTDHVLAQRLTMALVGTAAVAGVGVLARWLFDRRTSLVATALAAVSANFWMNDGLVMSESLATLGVVAVLIAVYVHAVRPSRSTALAFGVALGLAGLARAEFLLIGPLVFVPLTLVSQRSDPFTVRLQHLAIGAATAVLVISPWVIRNQIRFEEPTTMSTQDGLLLLGTNCPPAFEGPGRGFWLLACADDVEVPADADQSVRSAIYRDVALEFLGDNLDRLPNVVVARLGRGLSLWQVDSMTYLNEGEGRERWASWIGVWQFWVFGVLAAYGLWRWPSRQPRWPLVMTGSIAIVMIAAFYGIPRFRIPMEVGIVVCAAVSITAIWNRLWPGPTLSSAAAELAPADGERPGTVA